MQYLAVFLASIAGTLAKKIMIALGLGIVSFVGFQSIKSQVSSLISGYLGSLASDVYNVLALAGLVDCIGVWLSVFTVAVSFISMKRFGILTS